jgi:hypothetical protein
MVAALPDVELALTRQKPLVMQMISALTKPLEKF